MPTSRECVCCREIPPAVVTQPVGCVTEHPDYAAICLQTGVLRVAFWALEEAGDHPARGVEKCVFRFKLLYFFTELPLIGMLFSVFVNLALMQTGCKGLLIRGSWHEHSNGHNDVPTTLFSSLVSQLPSFSFWYLIFRLTFWLVSRASQEQRYVYGRLTQIALKKLSKFHIASAWNRSTITFTQCDWVRGGFQMSGCGAREQDHAQTHHDLRSKALNRLDLQILNMH